MAENTKGCGCVSLLAALGVGGLLLLAFIVIAGRNRGDKSSPSVPAVAVKQNPKVTADLSDFKVRREEERYGFTIKVTNHDAADVKVHAFVYAVNDKIIPPRREAWPAGRALFRLVGTDRGSLSPEALAKVFGKELTPGDGFGKGAEVKLKPGESETFESELIFEKKSSHRAWEGQAYEPRSSFDEISVWLFSTEGRLIFKKTYQIK